MDGLLPSIKRIRINAAPDGNIQNTGFTLPSKAVVLDVFLDVRVAEVAGAAKTLDVGRTSDPNGYMAAVDVSTTGLKKATLDNAGQTRGDLLVVDEDGAGTLVPEADVDGGGETIQYQAGSLGDWVQFRGDIYILYANLV